MYWSPMCLHFLHFLSLSFVGWNIASRASPQWTHCFSILIKLYQLIVSSPHKKAPLHFLFYPSHLRSVVLLLHFPGISDFAFCDKSPSSILREVNILSSASSIVKRGAWTPESCCSCHHVRRVHWVGLILLILIYWLLSSLFIKKYCSWALWRLEIDLITNTKIPNAIISLMSLLLT